MIPIRYLVCFLSVFIGVVTYFSRSNISMAIVPMTQRRNNNSTSGDGLLDDNLCPELLVLDADWREEHNITTAEVFDWSPEVQGSVLGCFFWTYFIGQLPAGYISGRWGGRVPITISFIVTAILTGLSPVFAHVSVYLLIISRTVMGIFQAAVFPGLFVIVMEWMPEHERAYGFAANENGMHIGNIIMYFSSGFLVNQYGWPALFYFPAISSLVALVVCLAFLRSRPEDHYLVTEEEIAVIRGTRRPFAKDKKGVDLNVWPCEADDRRASMDSISIDSNDSRNSIATQYPIPWKKILTNKSVLTLLFFKLARQMGMAFVSSNMPAYFKTVLHEDVVSVGIMYAISTGLTFSSVIICAKLSEAIITKGWISRTNCRKLFSLLSCGIPSLALMLIAAMRCNQIAVKGLFYLIAFGQGSVIASDSMLPAEMTTNFAAIVFSMSNIFTILPGFIAPMIVGSVLGTYGQYNWISYDIIIYLMGALGILANLVFVLFISAERQDFDDVSNDVQGSKRDMRSMSIVSSLSYSHRVTL